MYISITGLELKSPWNIFRFYGLAIPAMIQARASEGNLLAEAKKINGVHHTLSVWESKEQMLVFLHGEAHLKAIKSFSKIATGKTFGYESDRVPSWDEVPQKWQEYGRSYK